MATIKDLKSWIERDITRFSPSDECINWKIDCDVSLGLVDPVQVPSVIFKIYTDNNSYQIVAHERDEKSYLGCIASSRKPRAGEDWTRGNDLNDGDLSEETWHEILGDIISYEMVRIHRQPVEIQPVEETTGPSIEAVG